MCIRDRSFPNYIKNVAASELYPTWNENALRANILAQISVALNRVYNEFYRSRGYDFDITSDTQYEDVYKRQALADEATETGQRRRIAAHVVVLCAVPVSYTPLGALIASPGCYGETLYLFMARGLHFGKTHPDEDEFLDVTYLPFDRAVAQCLDGTLTDAKTVAAILKAKILLGR